MEAVEQAQQKQEEAEKKVRTIQCQYNKLQENEETMKEKADQKIKSLKQEMKEKTSFWQMVYIIFLVFEMIKSTVVQNDLFACIKVPIRVWCRYVEWVIRPSELNILGEKEYFSTEWSWCLRVMAIVIVVGIVIAGEMFVLKKIEQYRRVWDKYSIWYKENSRLDAIREKEFCAGYAFSHEEIVQYIMTIIPQEEVIVDATRKSVVSFPEIAIRELLANAMIHQDLQQRGTNPMVEVFKNRIEFSNAGAPLVAIERIVDSVPVSRNENIAGFMHKCGICEERGSGYDKIVEATGKNELLAPRIENQNNQFTKAILFAKVPFELTTKEDRMRTCYMQACLAYVNFEGISNSDIRKIFGLGEKEKAKASRLLTSAVEGGYIKVMDPDTAPRYKKYIPYWA